MTASSSPSPISSGYLSVLLTFSLLGVALATENMDSAETEIITSTTGHGFWLVGQTILERAMTSIGYGWLWANLYFH